MFHLDSKQLEDNWLLPVKPGKQRRERKAGGFRFLIPSYLHEQYLGVFLNLKAERDRVFLGNGLVGGEYTEPVAIV